ncbi:MAG: flagellar biosynthesis protein FlhB [Desulfatiglandales bacterium]
MEKTEKATPRRRTEARKRGKVLHSREISNFAVLLALCLFLMLIGGFFWKNSQDILIFGIEKLSQKEISEQSLRSTIFFLSWRFVITIFPLLLIVSLFGIASNIVQKPFAITWDIIKPRIVRFDLFAGIKRLFSYRYMIELLTSFLKLSVIGIAIFIVLSAAKEQIIFSPAMSFVGYLLFIYKLILKLIIVCTVIMGFLALADYFYQKWQYEKDLMMTKEEVKDEIKQLEGDPQVRSRIRSKQKAFARKRMLEAVKKADVVITNPTHIAVALLYESDSMVAPTVVAKGADWLALKIREVAKEAGVPVMENRILAHTLYKSVEVGEMIPVELYHAVAEVLAHVYRLKGKRV